MNFSLNFGKRTVKSLVSWDAGNDISETDYGWSMVREGSDSNTGRGRCLEPVPTQFKPIPPRSPKRFHLLLGLIHPYLLLPVCGRSFQSYQTKQIDLLPCPAEKELLKAGNKSWIFSGHLFNFSCYQSLAGDCSFGVETGSVSRKFVDPNSSSGVV